MIHPLSDVLSDNIGENTRIWQYCVVLPGAKIGHNCNICANVFIENKVVIGNNVTIKNGTQLWDGITVEDKVLIGPNATFTNELVPRSKVYDASKLKPTLIRTGASIGANATILAGVVIGRYSLVGAGTIITKDVPDYTLWYGHPATHRGYVTEEGIILDMDKRDEHGIQHELNTSNDD